MMARDEPLGSPIVDLISDEADTLNVNEVENEAQIAEQSGVSNTQSNVEIKCSPIVWIDDSSSVSFASSSSSTMYNDDFELSVNVNKNVYSEAEMELARKQWKLEIEDLKRQSKLKLEETQFELEQLLAQKERQLSEKELREREVRQKLKTKQKQLEQKEREIGALKNTIQERVSVAEKEKHTYFLRSHEHQKRVDELTKELEEMRLCNESLRLTSLKRKPIVEKQNAIRDIYESTSSVDRLEMMVITRIRDEKYYGFRRQLKGAFNAINQRTQISDNGRVVLWFVSNNAKRDFIDCKTYLCKQAKDAGVDLNISNNNIVLGDNGSVSLLKTAFGKLAGLLELDPTFMQKSLELVQGSLLNNPIEDKIQDLTDFANKHSDPMIVDIYNHVLRDVKLKLKM